MIVCKTVDDIRTISYISAIKMLPIMMNWMFAFHSNTRNNSNNNKMHLYCGSFISGFNVCVLLILDAADYVWSLPLNCARSIFS